MINRRKFLSSAAGAGALSFAGTTSMLSMLGNSKAYAAEVSGYKAIVCLFFFGGQDGHDTVLPYDQTSFDLYASHRSGLLSDYEGLPGGSSRTLDRLRELTPINAADFGSRKFALPEALDPVKSLFDSGNAAIIGNVGPLVEPIDSTEFEAGVKAQPKRLFSHNDQQSTWMSSAPEGEIQGWGGKLADAAQMSGANTADIFTGISTFGNTVFLSGNSTQQYILNTEGPPEVNGLKNFDSGLLVAQAENPKAVQLLEEQYRDIGALRSNLFERDLASIIDRSFAANEIFSNALDTAADLATSFPNSFVGSQLRSVAQAINIRSALGMGRQVFFVGMGGFDTHDNQAADLTALQSAYAQAISAFYQATMEMGLQNDVTLFTASDFGRALVENGNGTDHGWGSHHFIVGGAVNGNQIYGDIPPYDTGHANDAGNGRLIPTVSVEQYAATLGKWFGLTDAELLSALPALANFTQRDLGFMGA
ncbi:MAG: DUF1501 domain-containing protein [Hellea sp.]